MKKTIGISLLAALVTVFFAIAVYATLDHGTIKLAPGDEVYACSCGNACPCRTMSRNPGKCPCGNDLIKSKVVKVEGGMAVLNVNGQEESFPTTGKYACACGGGCNCDTISQSPGKCTCGTPMAPVK
ncbi:MAG: hypothetical protein P8130_06215 [Deltaproteobacteria bacterium]